MLLDGIHNVYNVSGVIIAAHEFLKLPYDKILESIATFEGFRVEWKSSHHWRKRMLL